MARRKSITPEEAIEALDKAIKKGEVGRPILLRLIKLGLEEQKRWKAIHHVERGRVDHLRGAEIAGLDPDGFRALLDQYRRPPAGGLPGVQGPGGPGPLGEG